MEIEITTLGLKYASLRVLDPSRVGRLVASIAREGQLSPVLAVGAEPVLVDGYHRVAALRELGRDLVRAVRLEVSEAEALVLAWRLETGRRKNALEEAWLLVELVGAHGRTQVEVAAELRRSRSWVSQRLGLVRALPEDVQGIYNGVAGSPRAASSQQRRHHETRIALNSSSSRSGTMPSTA